MNKTILLAVISVFFSLTLVANGPGAKISFDTENHDFGTIKEVDGPVETKFHFTNTGTTPLIVNNVKASCGCTTPEWTRKPVLPGEKGFISASYNPKGRPGKFEKSITITSNASDEPTKIVYISGEVEGQMLQRPE